MDLNRNVFETADNSPQVQADVEKEAREVTQVTDGEVFISAAFVDEVLKGAGERALLDGDMITLVKIYLVAKIFRDMKTYRLGLGN